MKILLSMVERVIEERRLFSLSEEKTLLPAIATLIAPFLAHQGIDYVRHVSLAYSLLPPQKKTGIAFFQDNVIHVVNPRIFFERIPLASLWFLGHLDITNLSKMFLIVVAHEMVHAWQAFHRCRLQENERCWMEAHACWVAMSFSKQHHLNDSYAFGLYVLTLYHRGRRLTNSLKKMLGLYRQEEDYLTPDFFQRCYVDLPRTLDFRNWSCVPLYER